MAYWNHVFFYDISGRKWGYLGQQKKVQKNFHGKKILKFIKTIHNFFHIWRTNSWNKSNKPRFMCYIIISHIINLLLLLFLRKILIAFTIILTLFFVFSFRKILLSFSDFFCLFFFSSSEMFWCFLRASFQTFSLCFW